jgi:murein DD-endopeptidase MepM/ murein hydrolase activator NlpD
MIRVSRTDDSFEARLEDLPSLTLTRHVQGVIDDSLFLSAYREGLPNSVIVNMIRIFSFDVDFQREIRKGDRFEIFYERKMSEDGRRVEEGNILFARLTLRGKPISLYRYKPAKALFADYFHDTGQSAKKALMRTPIEGARLSSYYGKRKHPVLGYTRMHKGLDFGAPTGTPIMAAGDGIVERASRYGAYGNYVRIRHNGTYKTAYAHLSKYGRGIKAGRRVKQGQVIGYVGATGRVTARHLHYEVLVNGKQVNPLRLKIPTGITLKGTDKKKFLTLAGDIDQRIMVKKQNILLTSNQVVAMNKADDANTNRLIMIGGF